MTLYEIADDVLELDKSALREALEHGEQVDGCAIADRGYHVRIR